MGEYYNKDWYEEWYGSGRKEGETYYFVLEHNENYLEEELKELSKDEWNRLEEWMGEQLIPNSEWEPASVFLSERDPESDSQG